MPCGKVQITNAPTVAGSEACRKNAAGDVGGVPHATAVRPTTSLEGAPIGLNSVAGVVGVTPMAAGRPRAYLLAVALTSVTPISISRIDLAAVETGNNSKAAAPDPVAVVVVTLDVLIMTSSDRSCCRQPLIDPNDLESR